MFECTLITVIITVIVLVVTSIVLSIRKGVHKTWNNGICADCNTAWELYDAYESYRNYRCQCDAGHAFSTQQYLPDCLPRDEKRALIRNINNLQSTAFHKEDNCLALLHWLRDTAMYNMFTPNNQACDIRIIEQHGIARFLLTKTIDGYLYALTLGRLDDRETAPKYILVTIEGPKVFFCKQQKDMEALQWFGTPPADLYAKLERYRAEEAAKNNEATETKDV